MKFADTLDPIVDSLWIALGTADASDTLSDRNDWHITYLKNVRSIKHPLSCNHSNIKDSEV